MDLLWLSVLADTELKMYVLFFPLIHCILLLFTDLPALHTVFFFHRNYYYPVRQCGLLPYWYIYIVNEFSIVRGVTTDSSRYYLKKSRICFVRKFGLSSGMKCPVFGNVIPVTLFATFWNVMVVKLPIARFSTYCQYGHL